MTNKKWYISDAKCLRTFMMQNKKYIQFWWKSENWYNYDAKLKAETFLMQNEKNYTIL